MKMVEFNIHSILRAQKDKPVEIDQFDVSLFWEGREDLLHEMDA